MAETIWNAAEHVVSSCLLYPGARAVLEAARRARRLSARMLIAARQELDRRCAELDLVELQDPIARAAGEFAERHRLRASDAVHLASALAIPAEVTAWAWDDQLRRASLEAGLSVAP